jgi:hypothetical protein
MFSFCQVHWKHGKKWRAGAFTHIQVLEGIHKLERRLVHAPIAAHRVLVRQALDRARRHVSALYLSVRERTKDKLLVLRERLRVWK